MSKEGPIAKELRMLRALGSEIVQRTSRLEEKLSPVQERATRKGLSKTELAIIKRNKKIGK